ncbi:MATE family efflux transporter [Termitidicoccus mucosus]|uniref:Multidrug-efflux transporter n=1 Tax=Termitidicoccus mucosus TaxID=1184151 RepID=A0A178IH17_9BACT|nr:MATE family efflux transporter [Opitutaceae bacterium TSB47]
MSAFFREARATLALAVPIIVGQTSQMLINVADTMMIGHVGTTELAAAAFAGSVFNVVFLGGIGLLAAVSIFTARANGAGDQAGVASWLRHGIALAVITILVQMAVLLPMGGHLHRFGQPPEVVAVVGPYYFLLGVSVVPAMLFQVFRQFAEAQGRPWVPMFIMLGGVALNVVFNWILIYGKLGAPAMGLAGAGLATLLARAGALAAIMAWTRGEPRLGEAWPRPAPGGNGGFWRRWTGGLRADGFGEMLKIGAPAAAMLLFEVTAFTMAALMMGWVSEQALAAHQIALTCAGTTFMVPLGISMAAGIRMSALLGEGRLEARRASGFGAVGMGCAFMSCTALVFVVAGGVIARGFVPEDAEVAALAARLLVVAGIFQIFDGAQVVSAGALRGLADVRVPTGITFAAYWLLAIPGGYFLGVRGSFGAVGIWGGLACGLAVAAVLLVRRLSRLTR